MKKTLLAMLLSACASIPVTEQVKIRAATDLKCDASRIEATQTDANAVRIDACGQERTYVKQCTVEPDPILIEAGFPSSTTHCNWVARGPASTYGDGSGGASR